MLSDFTKAKIGDFGCSKLFHNFNIVSTRCPGAADFMPPEAIRNDPVYGLKLDCFSFGHLALYLWNGKLPILDDSNITPADAHNDQRQVAKRRQSLRCFTTKDRSLKDLLIQCLSDVPEQRPSSEELFSFLSNYVSHEYTIVYATYKKGQLGHTYMYIRYCETHLVIFIVDW